MDGITLSRIFGIIQEFLQLPGLFDGPGFPAALRLEYEDRLNDYFRFEDIETPSGLRRTSTGLGPAQREREVQRLCEILWECTNTADPIPDEALDRHFAKLIHFVWERKPATTAVSESAIAKNVESILQRLSPDLLPLPELLQSLPNPTSRDASSPIPTSLIRLVVATVINRFQGYPSNSSAKMRTTILNSVGEMIEICTSHHQLASQEDQRSHWLAVKVFLWNYWQRLRACSLYFDVERDILDGCMRGFEQSRPVGDQYNSLRNFSLSPGLTMRAYGQSLAAREKPPNLCTWAFGLLYKDDVCKGLDFRHLTQRFSQVFGSITPRCTLDSPDTCDGSHADKCRRFRGGQVEDQSMHDEAPHSHVDEYKIAWDEQSYRDVNLVGARAVSVAATDTGPAHLRRLKYCKASERTLAFSHVWVHGQGGRPEDGINTCLHDRYVRLARSMGCDSYWIDSACIPTDHHLRREAISHINEVFRQSRAVIVCDKDIMTIDISGQYTEKLECVLAAILFCDWNIRAWTFLESVKGRETIHVLCKNRVVSFVEVARHLYYHGRVDIVVFISMLRHLLPGTRHAITNVADEDLRLEIAGSLLSYRPASRQGDDLVIWNLLIGRNLLTAESPSLFWRSLPTVATGFLMSSADRLSEPGLSWAPQSPFAAPSGEKEQNHTPIFHRPSSSIATSPGLITPEGLWASWWSFEFDFGFRSKLRRATRKDNSIHQELSKIGTQFSIKRYGALLRPISRHAHVVVHRLTNEPSSSNTGILVAICTSDKKEENLTPDEAWRKHGWKSHRWMWKGVYEWPSDVHLPKLRQNYSLWIG